MPPVEMTASWSGPETTGFSFPIVLGAIDVGSNGIRCAIARFAEPGRPEHLEHLRMPIRLGHDSFFRKRFRVETMDEAVAAFERFRRMFEGYGVRRYRAVATSAVRESRNGSELTRRIASRSDIRLEVIPPQEEARLVTLAVRHRLDVRGKWWALADLGGGSVEVTLSKDEEIAWVESFNMGSVRMLEELSSANATPQEQLRILEEYAAVLRLPAPSGRRGPPRYVATGGNAESIARLFDPKPDGGPVTVPIEDLRKQIRRLAGMTVAERIQKLGLKPDRADVILPAAVVFARIAEELQADAMIVPFVGVKDGILLDIADGGSPEKHDGELDHQVEASALSLGRKYQFDERHARQVSRMALELFDQTGEIHRLDRHDRRVLHAAALLHEIGNFVSRSGHHKHSLYLIRASGIVGLSPEDTAVVANVARYHRKSPPKPEHMEFEALTKNDRTRVVRLAALLRIADSLDHEHQKMVREVKVRREPGVLRILVRSPGDLLLEKWSLTRKSDMFVTEFGLKPVLETIPD
jgi:exopolyphosphatase/guanosine-5'-triphosphate,3'-diphosphate pyrophosphatase